MPTVLIVDDEAAIRDLVEDTLALAGHDVIVAASGVEALAQIATCRPDCLVLDVMMPGMSGLEVLNRLRQDPATSGLPVIMLTARVDDVSTWQGWQAGADLYLEKPFDPADLTAWVQRVVPCRRTPHLSAWSETDTTLRRVMMNELHLLAL